MTPDDVLAATVREEWGRLVALLLAQFRRLDLVEDALADAVEAAARTWPRDGAPERPAAWLMTTARRRVVDRLRAEAVALRKEPLLVVDAQADRRPTEEPWPTPVTSSTTTCCASCSCAATRRSRPRWRVRSPCASSSVCPPTTSRGSSSCRCRRWPRGSREGSARSSTAGIPFGVPDASVLPERLEVVAQVAYLAFTAGYAPGTGPDLLRADLSGEAVRLVRVTLALRPEEPTLRALLALLLLQHSRRDARVGPDGDLVLLPDQDRSRWHHDEVAEALGLLDGMPSPSTSALAESYRLQALVAAEHATAATASETRWDRICDHYAALVELTPSPAVRLAAAVALAERDGPRAGLDALDGLDDELPAQPPAARSARRAARPAR